MWTLYLVFWAPDRPKDTRWVKTVAMAFGAVGLGVAISAIQALPFLDYIQFSPRGAGGPSLGWQYSTAPTSGAGLLPQMLRSILR